MKKLTLSALILAASFTSAQAADMATTTVQTVAVNCESYRMGAPKDYLSAMTRYAQCKAAKPVAVVYTGSVVAEQQPAVRVRYRNVF